MKATNKFDWNSKVLKLVLQLMFVGIVFFFMFNQNVISEIRYLLDTLNIRGQEKLVAELVISFKAVFDASSVSSIIVFILGFIITMIVVPFVIYFVFKKVSQFILNRKSKNIAVKTVPTLNKEEVYILQSRFLC